MKHTLITSLTAAAMSVASMAAQAADTNHRSITT